MKTRNFIFATLLTVLGVAVYANDKEKANESPKVEIVHVKDDIFKLIYVGTTRQKIIVRIKDEQGKLVFTENLKRDKFIRPYNFSHLQGGMYTIEIHDVNGIITKMIGHKEPFIKSSYMENPLVLIRPLNKEDKKYQLTIANQGEKRLRVNIYENGSVLIHTANEVLDGNYSKIFNLKSIIGEVTMEVEIANVIKRFEL